MRGRISQRPAHSDPLPFNTLYDSEDSLVMLRGLILILCGISLVKANKYCDICPKHTMCVFKEHKPSNSCNEFQHYPLTQNEKFQILTYHNRVRSKVACGIENRGLTGPQPSASNMIELTWDEELERIAQRWAFQCNGNAHDACRDVDRFSVGQNMVVAGYTTPEFESELIELLDMWYEEVDDFPIKVLPNYTKDSFPNEKISHYTQMVWADTYKIGCGRSVFVLTDSEVDYTAEFLVCNYGPAGNVLDTPVYQFGPPASNCSFGKESFYFSGLCAGPLNDIRGKDARKDLVHDSVGTKFDSPFIRYPSNYNHYHYLIMTTESEHNSEDTARDKTVLVNTAQLISNFRPLACTNDFSEPCIYFTLNEASNVTLRVANSQVKQYLLHNNATEIIFKVEDEHSNSLFLTVDDGDDVQTLQFSSFKKSLDSDEKLIWVKAEQELESYKKSNSSNIRIGGSNNHNTTRKIVMFKILDDVWYLS